MLRISCRCGAAGAEAHGDAPQAALRAAPGGQPARVLLALAIALILSGCAGRSGRPPAVSPSASSQANASLPSGEHVVQRGETLAAIGRRYGTSYLTLARLNGIRSPYTIYPGQRLRVPGTAGAPAPTPVTPAGGWTWPTAGTTLRGYVAAHGGNKGLDIAGQIGQPIRAAAAGTVVYAGNGLRQYGNLLIVKHNEDYLSAYGYLQKIAVAEGSTVSGGQTIASMGSPGDGRGVLHFEIRYRGTPIDPAAVLPRPSGG